MNTLSPLPLVLTAFGLPHVMGYLATQGGQIPREPLGAVGLMRTAAELGLSGVELVLPHQDAAAMEALHAARSERDLAVVAAFGVLVNVEVAEVRAYLEASAAIGARVVRALLSPILCGDRRRFAGGWDAHLARNAERLREILPIAAELGLALALENHQDATSADLLRLAEMVGHHPAFGVTLDAGNPLAVGEDPLEYARRVAPLIRHLHLKDYTLHFAPEGYRLVRCAAGDGVIPFPAIREIVAGNGHAVLPGIEIAAQQTRTIPLLEADWWEGYPHASATHLLPVLRLLWEKGRPQAEPYGSAWERGGDSTTVSTEEWDLVHRSVAYFRRTAL